MIDFLRTFTILVAASNEEYLALLSVSLGLLPTILLSLLWSWPGVCLFSRFVGVGDLGALKLPPALGRSNHAAAAATGQSTLKFFRVTLPQLAGAQRARALVTPAKERARSLVE